MKICLTLAMALFAIQIFAQTDSTEIKLSQYKKWLDMGLIDKPEYDVLKNKLLKKELSDEPVMPPKAPPKSETKTDNSDSFEDYATARIRKIDTMPLPALKERATLKLIAGSIFMAGSIAAGVTTINLINTNHKISATISIGIVSGFSLATSIVLLATGGIDYSLYKTRKKSTITFSPSTKDIGLALKF
ncbi:MAG: hypothetical protein KIS94_05550 [Chitinophagales bacterium]|nr:hypothetical protein [Chitinophagales bacterium]